MISSSGWDIKKLLLNWAVSI